MSFDLKFERDIIPMAHDGEDSTLGEAIETAFPESAFVEMIWNGVAIRLSWKYDIGQIWRDILVMLQLIRMQEDFSFYWPSSSFLANWQIYRISTRNISIESLWTSVWGEGEETLQLLAEVDDWTEVDRTKFVRQWRNLLSVINHTLISANYRPKDLYGFESLLKEIGCNEGVGNKSLWIYPT